ncbi:MAG: tail fiber protein, partial [Bacteroidota bacterium]
LWHKPLQQNIGEIIMADPFIGEIKMVGFSFAPLNYAYCAGALLPIGSNQTLYSLIGTSFGGDGRVTFALPDMRSRIPVMANMAGGGTGLTPYPMGTKSGIEKVTLTESELPPHSHVAATDVTIQPSALKVDGSNFVAHLKGTDVQADEPGPDSERVLAEATTGNVYKDGGNPTIPLKAGSVTVSGVAPVTGAPGVSSSTTTVLPNGGGLGHFNIQPIQAVNFIIAMTGIYPSRN